MKPQLKGLRSKGFALVITLSLMILLTVIAVGLLTLATISLRASSQGQDMAMARSHARLAVMLAIGDLQKSLGPDRAVTASSEVLSATPAKPHTTGVWESWWDFNLDSASLNYTTEKQKRFRRWLVSNADPAALEAPGFATAKWSGKTIELVGGNSLGGDKVAASAKVVAGKVPVARNGQVEGAYAWHVADEAQKARINLYRDPDQNTTVAQQRALLAGQRPDPSVIKGADGNLLTCLPADTDTAAFKKASETSAKLTDLDQTELLDQAKGKIKPLRHDLTPWSLGVLADVRGGGLKQDLSSVFEMSTALATNLPSEFSGKKLYQSTHKTTGVSDPYWSTLAGYYNSFRSITDLEGKQDGPTYASTVAPESPITTPVPTRYNPSPVIAKVDTIFSLVARPMTDIFWLGGMKEVFDYHVNLIFTPVVTLHNPYNVNISFHKLEVSFENIPVAFNFMFQAGGVGGFVSQCVVPGSFEAINTMSYSGSEHNGRKTKKFIMNIANWNDANPIATSSTISGPIVMKPGQTLVCGPIFPPDSSFQKDAGLGHDTLGFDWDNRLTTAIKAKPSFTPGLGYEMYAVTIAHIRQPGNVYPGGWTGHPFMMLRDLGASPKISQTTTTDRFYMEFKIQRPSWYVDDASVTPVDALASFAVNAKLQSTASGTLSDYAKLEFNYQSDSSLKSFFNNQVFRYPPTDSLTGHECAAPGGVTYATQGAYVHSFAIFSAYARTTNGGVYETGLRTPGSGVNLLRDGRLAGKPFLFHNPSRANFTMDLASEKPGVQAYELNFQPFLSKGDYQDYMDVEANRVPALTGNTTARGIKSGSYLELPTGPMQTIADFRKSNALTTSYLPNTVQPVANSLVSAMMSTDKVKQTDTDVAPNELLDHSVLANHALYDRFYFSTFATRGNETPDTVFEKFMNGSTPLPSQAFQPYRPGGRSVADAKAELFASGKPKDDAYKSAAEYQMIQGPFNVNSTSVQAWKAVLASMNKSEIVTLWAKTNKIELRKAAGVPILGMSLLNGGVVGETADFTKIDNVKTNDWNGHRELTDKELETLATRIVEQVRTRGPFLSMSEFVNRQIGPNGPLTQRGALEAAISDSKINDNFFKNNPEGPKVTDIAMTNISDPKIYKYNTPEVVTGNPAAGAPGWISQGDLLRILEPAATVRGDTFVIRVCGEAWDPNGKVTARAYAEAVVQRVPEYVDPADRPSLNAFTTTTAAKANKTFGRRINLVSFRWLSGNEI
jgi:hypothetical protein